MNNHFSPKPKTSWLTIAFLCLLAGLVFYLISHHLQTTYEAASQCSNPVITSGAKTQRKVENPSQNMESPSIPDEFLLKMSFTSQAPHANWDAPYQEACEEGAILNVHFFHQGKTFTPEIADQELLKMIDFENSYFGFYEDTTASQTAELIREYWGYKRVEVIKNPTAEEIKKQVAASRPVVVPCAGRQLGNPNYTQPGPLYHMLVIRGYTPDEFITNDVGTRRGEEYTYDIEVVMSAMHDWNGGEVENGQKVMIVVYPNE